MPGPGLVLKGSECRDERALVLDPRVLMVKFGPWGLLVSGLVLCGVPCDSAYVVAA